MRRISIALLCLSLSATACRSGGETLSEDTMNARIDSMVGEQTKDLIRQSEEDLDRRMAIEVKAKADSIIAARAAGRDTGARPVPQP